MGRLAPPECYCSSLLLLNYQSFSVLSTQPGSDLLDRCGWLDKWVERLTYHSSQCHSNKWRGVGEMGKMEEQVFCLHVGTTCMPDAWGDQKRCWTAPNWSYWQLHEDFVWYRNRWNFRSPGTSEVLFLSRSFPLKGLDSVTSSEVSAVCLPWLWGAGRKQWWF